MMLKLVDESAVGEGNWWSILHLSFNFWSNFSCNSNSRLLILMKCVLYLPLTCL